MLRSTTHHLWHTLHRWLPWFIGAYFIVKYVILGYPVQGSLIGLFVGYLVAALAQRQVFTLPIRLVIYCTVALNIFIAAYVAIDQSVP